MSHGIQTGLSLAQWSCAIKCRFFMDIPSFLVIRMHLPPSILLIFSILLYFCKTSLAFLKSSYIFFDMYRRGMPAIEIDRLARSLQALLPSTKGTPDDMRKPPEWYNGHILLQRMCPHKRKSITPRWMYIGEKGI